MKKKGRPPGVSASLTGIEQLKKAKGQLTYKNIATKAHVEEKTVRRFFSGEKVNLGNADAIIKVLGLEEKNILLSENLSSMDDILEDARDTIETNGINSERASEFLRELEGIFKEYKKSSDLSRQAMDWLKVNRHAFVKEATEESLKQFYSQNHQREEIEYSTKEKQLSKDLLKYLNLLNSCLTIGALEFLEEARRKSLIPLNLDAELYVQALIFIKEQKLAKNWNQFQELELYLNHLIVNIPLMY